MSTVTQLRPIRQKLRKLDRLGELRARRIELLTSKNSPDQVRDILYEEFKHVLEETEVSEVSEEV